MNTSEGQRQKNVKGREKGVRVQTDTKKKSTCAQLDRKAESSPLRCSGRVSDEFSMCLHLAKEEERPNAQL